MVTSHYQCMFHMIQPVATRGADLSPIHCAISMGFIGILDLGMYGIG